jgi:DNA adenine methylase
MPTTDYPLRYPGGKTQLTPLVIEILRANELFYGHYIEPCAGGAGIAWKLLLNGYVTHVHINDIDPAIHAFWECVLNRADDLCERVATANVTMAMWYRQRGIHRRQDISDKLSLAFATLFLNRTNRSGIITGGVIGGQDQEGDYPIDCRFYRETLIRKIQRIAQYRRQVTLHRRDAKTYLTTVVPKLPQRSLVNLDPPYYVKGPELYRNHYTPRDHEHLAHAIKTVSQRWMVSYDDTPETRRLYRGLPSFTQELEYTAQDKRTGVELLVLDRRLQVPPSLQATMGLAA